MLLVKFIKITIDLYENLNEVADNAKDLINDVKENPTKYVKAYWQGRK